VLDKFEKIPVQPATDRPLKPIRIIDVSIFKDPFAEYKKQLSKRLERDASKKVADKATKKSREEKEKDRTTWFGTQLGEKGDEMVLDGLGGVGKYLHKKVEPMTVQTASNAGQQQKRQLPETEEMGMAAAKRKKKTAGGGFGDFSGW